ncbi:hypothetical protein H0A73_12205 [Alcaligenaceae bacterium]|nr:hypothetical protein [Alcaligenaceae bacterium]
MSVKGIDARITHLTHMLGLDLSQEANILRVYRLEGAGAGGRHHGQGMEELRALLVIRYSMIQQCAQSLGLAATRSLFVRTDKQSMVKGVNPDASAADVRHLFGEA